MSEHEIHLAKIPSIADLRDDLLVATFAQPREFVGIEGAELYFLDIIAERLGSMDELGRMRFLGMIALSGGLVEVNIDPYERDDSLGRVRPLTDEEVKKKYPSYER